MTPAVPRPRTLIAVAAVVAVAACYPAVFPTKLNLGVAIVLFAATATAWDVLGGWGGQLSLGHAALMGVGGYTMALLALRAGVAPWWGLLAGMLLAALVAAVWGWVVFRLRGPYFVLSTIAVAEILRLVAINWTSFTGGAEGLFIKSLPRPLGLDLFDRAVEFYMGLGWLALALLVAWWLSWSRFGYYLQAIREDQDSAMAMGINPTRVKVAAFMLSAALTAAGGALFAVYVSFFEPHIIFDIGMSVELALMAYIGGAGTVFGPAIGAAVLLVAGDLFRNYFQQANLLIYGVLIILIVRFAPEGIVGGWRLLARRWPGGRRALPQPAE
ncbi:MAG: branched-chain amino acid ABC transporter permease [Armatimonadota bacterium]|nr:branched-chain amino acid ABC transporter permease [Armatimonadota bacterium]MDR7466384.1 branched-chain amino acid ABC transporter permease [Armatimonadota bacterium]MDR7493106.1 branched-chain amino acid ABC transporter permease [Armatimonadota bacterium]MDR7498137.1 branched-chain amino acid ABC transporter permease [Armatimonadota bacterium]MDR7503603.1 branched-chain amino acid ABC transporter permease [Armatimonadota bacterium]